MADAKISALTTASALAGTEVLPIVQSSTTKKVAVDDLTVKNIRSNATTGLLQIAGPAAAATRTMTVPDANFTAARTDAAQTFTGVQTFTSPKILTDISDTNGNELIKFQVTSSAVNEITVKNSATGGQPAILATGGDTDVSLLLTAKGAGAVNATTVAVFDAGLRVVGPTPSFNQGAISYEYPFTRHYTGDGSGYSWAVSKRTGGATVDLLTVPDNTNNVTVNLGSLIIGTAGKGIDFSATTQPAAGMTSELLADYEEGTWTPTFTSTGATFAYSSQTGTYIKIGKLVYASFQLGMGAGANGTVTNAVLLAGLPFTAAEYGGLNNAWQNLSLVPTGIAIGTSIYLYGQGTVTQLTPTTSGLISSGRNIAGVMIYSV